MYKPKKRHCKDCPVEGTREAKYPGPRCATHWREYKARSNKRGHELMVQKTYKLLPGEYDQRYEAQGGKCAICQYATGASRRLAVDHDHKTGRVRGLLCSPCNQFIGRMRDSAEAFLRAYQYLGQDVSQQLWNKMVSEKADAVINKRKEA